VFEAFVRVELSEMAAGLFRTGRPHFFFLPREESGFLFRWGSVILLTLLRGEMAGGGCGLLSDGCGGAGGPPLLPSAPTLPVGGRSRSRFHLRCLSIVFFFCRWRAITPSAAPNIPRPTSPSCPVVRVLSFSLFCWTRVLGAASTASRGGSHERPRCRASGSDARPVC